MNFIARPDHFGGYRRVNGSPCGIPLFHKSEADSYVKTSLSWKWRKGSRVSTVNDWLQIKIGGDDEEKKKKRRHKANCIKSTKYTFLTFLPQNLLEQFRHTPVSPMTSLLPLVFVVAVTAAKQGYEDFLRYKTDNIINRSPVTVILEGFEKTIQSQYVQPGDLVVVERDCDVPCDLVLMRSSDPHGKCFITTANLDGETNLKTLMVPRDIPTVDLDKLHKLGIIECESSKTDLYNFNGKIELSSPEGKVLPLSAENLLLRGSRVKNTECVIGCAVYTGMTTKLQLNSRRTRNKISSCEMYINRFLIFILIVLIGIVTLLYFLKRYNEIFVIPHLHYLVPTEDVYSVKQFLQDYLSFLILFNYLIPISLYVTIEMHRVLGGLFMEWDLQLYDELNDQPCIVNTSNLNEELGQINILFSDKTGTLTKNEMIFQQCSIAGKKFKYKKTRLQEEGSLQQIDLHKFNRDQRIFFQALTICHTVQVAGSDNSSNMNASQITLEKRYSTESCTNVYTIGDITEESYNSSQQSDVNAMETSLSIDPTGIQAANSSTTSDVNPLLSDISKIEKRRKPVIIKRSPNFTRASNRIHPMSLISNNLNIQSSIHNFKGGGRPISLQFQRSTSEIDLPERSSNVTDTNSSAKRVLQHGHRRTQSYGTPTAYIMQTQASSAVYRSPSTTSRESYAAPNFQRQPTLLLRAESQRRKNEIANVVSSLDYQASSPDEKALVEACAYLGLVYMGDDDNELRIRIAPPHLDYSRAFYGNKSNDELNFIRLHILEFTSDRKRMSVIVRDDRGDKWIYCKGAESYVFPLCDRNCQEMIAKTDAHISDFSRLGLRTLAVARKKLSEEEYQQFLQKLNEANNSLEGRKELSEKCYAHIENKDALQDDVADTLISLQKAGIKIWVLTGDKVETALNIALACGHVPSDALKYFIVECRRKDDMLLHLNILDREIIFGMGRDCVLLIDGKSLTVALNETPNEFRDVAVKCTAVLCCRLSPLQKSEVVSLIKTSTQNYNTAAIGDGANDVSMIQEAHVGIGIIGKEGRQAACCSDFALAKFCMLKRLLLVHGHYHTTRLTLLVLYFFYKNIFFMGSMFLFQFHTLFSSVSVYDSLFLTLYNVMYTSLPIFFISLTEKCYAEQTLMSQPELYQKNINNKNLRWSYFIRWILHAVYHALICFYFTVNIFSTNDILLNVGQTVEFSCFGTLLMQLVVIVSNLKLWLESKYLSYWYIFTIIGSIFSFMMTTFIYNVIDIRYDTDIYWSYNKLLSSLPIWLFCLLITIVCLLPDFTIRVLKQAFNLPDRKLFPGKERLRLLQMSGVKVEITRL
uniref:Phospholipid-transporting ATPase n=1 Tax=Glossina brevipalpis TaxID=37001 RepID=A0A1A9WFD3_9MUSC